MGAAGAERAQAGEGRSRILLADDQPIVRWGLARLLESQPDVEVCWEADEPAAALRAIEQGHPNIAILEVSLRGHSGIELTKDIVSRDPGLPVLIFSGHDEVLYAERALRAGARGYIMKQEPLDRVVAAVRKVLSGQICLSERMADRLLQRLAANGARAAESPLAPLSDRELQVFELLGHGFSTRQIAQVLYRSVKTIETHRAHIKDKLRIPTSSELLQRAIHWVHDVGKS